MGQVGFPGAGNIPSATVALRAAMAEVGSILPEMTDPLCRLTARGGLTAALPTAPTLANDALHHGLNGFGRCPGLPQDEDRDDPI